MHGTVAIGRLFFELLIYVSRDEKESPVSQNLVLISLLFHLLVDIAQVLCLRAKDAVKAKEKRSNRFWHKKDKNRFVSGQIFNVP